MGRRPPAWYEISDDGFYEADARGLRHWREVLGVVRYDGDRDTWDRLIVDFCRATGRDEVTPDRFEEPVVRWFRMNPDWTREYSWLLTPVDGPGPGNWQGAKIIWKGEAE